MSDTFLYNQEVTAEDLNNIAIDLGLPEYSAFSDGTLYAVDALNQITADLVEPGILLTGNRCSVTYQNGIIYVDTGIVVFNSGAKKRIDEKQSFTALEGKSYIYAIHDTANNRISLVCADAFPAEGDYIKLATVEDGVVTGLRTTCKSKTDLKTLNLSEDVEDFYFSTYKSEYGNDYLLKKTINCNIECFRFMLFDFERERSNRIDLGRILIDLATDEPVFIEDIVDNTMIDVSIKIIRNLNTIQIYTKPDWDRYSESWFFKNVKVL